jgi:ribonucleoside-diphosphate reductase alpha chain
MKNMKIEQIKDLFKDMSHDGTWGGIEFKRYYTQAGIDPFETVKWEKREGLIQNEKGDVMFRQENVEFPSFYSQLAVNIIVSKYFRGNLESQSREKTMRQLVSRVVSTITGWGVRDGYFHDQGSAQAFSDELKYLLLYQISSFNSPVWFNVGVEKHPQCSACFINSVEDTMESILNLVKTEGMLFKFGSGTGTNFSPLRSAREELRGGGRPSGPVSFMKGFDAFAGVIKSGGKTRRAAKMVILNADHPDIMEFIACKEREEKKACSLIDAGYDGSFNGEAYNSVFFQNSNNSVRVTDNFMNAVVNDAEWQTKALTNHRVMDTYRAGEVMDAIARAAHACGDPGLQFDTTVNGWNTVPKSGRINASNPCSEFMFLDDSACNLSSLNLMKFINDDGQFDCNAFIHAVRTMIVAQDIIVGNASYPTKKIEKNSNDFRALGLGYANLGGLLMALGLPYDSDEGRAYAAAVTSLMSATAYETSAEIASRLETFSFFSTNKEPMLDVIEKHKTCHEKIDRDKVPDSLCNDGAEAWNRVLSKGKKWGFRNAQVTLLAPTGTIGFMMDCDTTGIEPDIALVKYKKLVGGGTIKIVNQTVPKAIEKLGYSKKQIREIDEYIQKNETIEGAPHIREDHLSVFDCAIKPAMGKRCISVKGHIRMMAAVQPFLSGAISKTVNMPNEATVHDVRETFMEAWKLGLKAIAIYRYGCKRVQPVTVDMKERETSVEYRPVRRKLPDERKSITHKFSIGGHEGYITVGMYDDGNPGEIFVVMAKQGSVVSGLMDSFATAISISLQYGVPLRVLVDKFIHSRFEPSGYTNNPKIRYAKSIMDYIFQWLALRFLGEEMKNDAKFDEGYIRNLASDSNNGIESAENAQKNVKDAAFLAQQDSPPCRDCGSIMIRSGTCYTCLNCGTTSGCS